MMGLPRGDARCLVCNACNRLALLDSAGIDVLIRYILEYKPGSIDMADDNGKDVVGIAKKKNKLYLFMLGYLDSDTNARLYEVKALIRAIDAILNKQEFPSMRDLSKLVRSYSPKYDPYGYWDTVGEYDPVESVTKMLEEVVKITETSTKPTITTRYLKSPFYDVISVVPDTLRRLPAIEVKNVAVSKFKFDRTVWERLSNTSFPVRLYLISRHDHRDPNSDQSMSTKIDYGDDTPTAFPTPIEVWFNNIQIKARFKGLKNKEGTVNPVDLTEHIKSWRAQNVLKIIHVFNKEPYLAYCALVRPYTPEEVLNNILIKPAIPYSMTKEYITKIFQENDGDGDDTELITTSTIISLKCPISYSRIRYPIKSKRCDHLQCYDALWFLHSQVQVPNWVCPVCQIPVTLDELYICEFSMRILNSCASNVEQIELLPDFSWSPIYEMEDVSDSDDDAPASNSKKEPLSKLVPQSTKARGKAEPPQLSHKIKDTPVVSLLSDDDEDEDMDKEVNSIPNNSPSKNLSNSTSHSKNITLEGNNKNQTLDPVRKPHNGSVQKKTIEKNLQHSSNNSATKVNNGDDDDDDDDLPLAQVARKRGLPIDHLLNPTDGASKLPAIRNTHTGLKSRLHEKRKLSSSFAPNILGKKPLKNTTDTTILHQMSRDERQLFVSEDSDEARTLDPKTDQNSWKNNFGQTISPSISNETVVIHEGHLPSIRQPNDGLKNGFLDSNPFVNKAPKNTIPNNAPYVSFQQAQPSRNPSFGSQSSINSGTKNPTLPPLPTNIINRANTGTMHIRGTNENKNHNTNLKPSINNVVSNPLGSRPVVNPFLPRKPSTTINNGQVELSGNPNNGDRNNGKKESPWLL